jgi:hypothetical protein
MGGKVEREHLAGRIAKNPQDYKQCGRCRKINWHQNKRCNGCRHQNLNGMEDKYGRTLLLDWNKEPDLLLEV